MVPLVWLLNGELLFAVRTIPGFESLQVEEFVEMLKAQVVTRKKYTSRGTEVSTRVWRVNCSDIHG